MFIAGCVSSAVDPFFNIDYLCNRFYDKYQRWPVSETELKEYELKYSTIETDWNTISVLSIMKISEDHIYIICDIPRWYGKDTVSGSVYRPKITINIKSVNETESVNDLPR